MTRTEQIRFVLKPLVFGLALLPAALVVTDVAGLTGGLGVNAVEDVLDRFGNWGLRFVMIALAVTPLRQLTGWQWLARFRRMLGLFAFFYVAMHFLTYLALDRGFDMATVLEDVAERPFITLGFLALVLLTAMAATSTNAMRRRLGRRWQQLHYGVYAVGVLAVWHYWWQVKADILEPLVYALILSLLLGYRLYRHVTAGGPARRAGAARRSHA